MWSGAIRYPNGLQNGPVPRTRREDPTSAGGCVRRADGSSRRSEPWVLRSSEKGSIRPLTNSLDARCGPRDTPSRRRWRASVPFIEWSTVVARQSFSVRSGPRGSGGLRRASAMMPIPFDPASGAAVGSGALSAAPDTSIEGGEGGRASRHEDPIAPRGGPRGHGTTHGSLEGCRRGAPGGQLRPRDVARGSGDRACRLAPGRLADVPAEPAAHRRELRGHPLVRPRAEPAPALDVQDGRRHRRLAHDRRRRGVRRLVGRLRVRAQRVHRRADLEDVHRHDERAAVLPAGARRVVHRHRLQRHGLRRRRGRQLVCAQRIDRPGALVDPDRQPGKRLLQLGQPAHLWQLRVHRRREPR